MDPPSRDTLVRMAAEEDGAQFDEESSEVDEGEPIEDTKEDVVTISTVEADAGAHTKTIDYDNVEVEAPVDLPEGYQLQVTVNDQTLMATIPEGGASQGQTVTCKCYTVTPVSVAKEEEVARVVSSNGSIAEIPRGQWRDNFCACLQYIGTPAFWVSFCVSPISLGQIMTRNLLNWVGEPEMTWQDRSAFYFFLVAWVVTYLYFVIFVGLVWYMSLIVYSAFSFFNLVMMIKTRKHIRNTYDIPGSVLNDCCASYWCGCCTLIQMASNTADLKKGGSSKCCTPTGLDPNELPIQQLPELPPENLKDKHALKMRKRKAVWLALGALMFVLLIVAAVLAAAAPTTDSLRGTSSYYSSSYSGSSSCERERTRCRVYKCKNEFNGWTGNLDYNCGYEYEYRYVRCGRCP